MADPFTLARAFIDAVNMPVVPPSHDSPDGLPANEAALEAADDALMEALAVVRGRVSAREVAWAILELDALDQIGAGQ